MRFPPKTTSLGSVMLSTPSNREPR